MMMDLDSIRVDEKRIKVVFIVPPQVHILDLTGPAHLFYEAADYGAGVELAFCSMSSEATEVASSCQLSLGNLEPFNRLHLRADDFVFVPGLDSSTLLSPAFSQSSKGFLSWLLKQYQNGATVCSVCTGSFLLAEAGLLDGKECTTHWKYTDRFKQRYPSAKLLGNRLFVQDDRLYTSAGVSSGIDLALYIIEKVWGPAFAARIAKEVVIFFRRTLDDPQLNIFTQYRNHIDERIHAVQDKLIQSIDKKVNIDELALEVSMSPRNLTRLFKRTTGLTLGNYQWRLRFNYAQKLLLEGHTHQSTALQCGLKSSRQLQRLLKKFGPDDKD